MIFFLFNNFKDNIKFFTLFDNTNIVKSYSSEGVNFIKSRFS
jgi:hypothetical protein